VEIYDHRLGDAVNDEFLWMPLTRRSRLFGEL
jgi:hypothetical protein